VEENTNAASQNTGISIPVDSQPAEVKDPEEDLKIQEINVPEEQAEPLVDVEESLKNELAPPGTLPVQPPVVQTLVIPPPGVEAQNDGFQQRQLELEASEISSSDVDIIPQHVPPVRDIPNPAGQMASVHSSLPPNILPTVHPPRVTIAIQQPSVSVPIQQPPRVTVPPPALPGHVIPGLPVLPGMPPIPVILSLMFA